MSNREELADMLLDMLYEKRIDEMASVCEAFLDCRNQMRNERREDNILMSLTTPEERESIEQGGALAEAVSKFLKEGDHRSAETVLKKYSKAP